MMSTPDPSLPLPGPIGLDPARFISDVSGLLQDPAFVGIAHDLHDIGFFAVLGMTHNERWHSAFLAWLINPAGSHGLGWFPLRRLLVHLATPDEAAQSASATRSLMLPPHELESAEFVSCAIWPNAEVSGDESERTVHLGADKGKLSFDVTAVIECDVWCQGRTRRERLLLICENKVGAKEGRGGGQTAHYACWSLAGMNESRDAELLETLQASTDKDTAGLKLDLATLRDRAAHYRETRRSWFAGLAKQKQSDEAYDDSRVRRVLVFLRPTFHGTPLKASSPWFLPISYQELVDHVLAPCEHHPALTPTGRLILGEYLKNLGTVVHSGSHRKLAYSPRQTQLAERLWARHGAILGQLVRAAGRAESEDQGTPAPVPLVTIDDLVRGGVLQPGTRLHYREGRAERLGAVRCLTGSSQHGIQFDESDEVYRTPSAAAKSVHERGVSQGWNFIRVVGADGADGPSLADLRDPLKRQRETTPEPPLPAEMVMHARSVLQQREYVGVFEVLEGVRRRTERDFRIPLLRAPKSRSDFSCLWNGEAIPAFYAADRRYTALIDVSKGGGLFCGVAFDGTPISSEQLSGNAATMLVLDRCGQKVGKGYQWSRMWCLGGNGQTFEAARREAEGQG